jgi:hypothetical protein
MGQLTSGELPDSVTASVAAGSSTGTLVPERTVDVDVDDATVPSGTEGAVPDKPVGRPEPDADEVARRLAFRRRLIGVLLECLTALVTIAVFLAWCHVIKHNPLLRASQVSGMAKIDLRFLVLGFAVIGAALVAERFAPPWIRQYTPQIACAAIAALASSLVAAGVMFALNGTPYGILAGGSDFGWIADWISQYDKTGSFPSHYPPLPIYLIWMAVKVTGEPVAIVTKPLEIIGTALYGPLVYLSWRMVLKPIWALAIGVVAMLPFIEPFKVYAQLVLVLFVPVLIKYFMVVRRSHELTRRGAAWWGAGFGAGLATLFLLYSGWFVWALPGAVLAFAILAPWRRAADRALLLAGTTVAVFLPLTWVHLTGLLSSTGGVSDNYQYFDTRTDPAYIAMWRNDSGANVGSVWPPFGELGNVGVFSVLLVAGLALALALGWRRTPVVVACTGIAGAWILRFYLAGKMYETNLVRLYPRTTQFILYLLLILVGYAIYFATNRVRELYQRLAASTGADSEPSPRRGVPFALMLAPLLLLFLFMGSATVDRLMPADRPGTDADATWISHATNLPNGKCPIYGRGVACIER